MARGFYRRRLYHAIRELAGTDGHERAQYEQHETPRPDFALDRPRPPVPEKAAPRPVIVTRRRADLHQQRLRPR